MSIEQFMKIEHDGQGKFTIKVKKTLWDLLQSANRSISVTNSEYYALDVQEAVNMKSEFLAMFVDDPPCDDSDCLPSEGK